jgi:hypothetical protein
MSAYGPKQTSASGNTLALALRRAAEPDARYAQIEVAMTPRNSFIVQSVIVFVFLSAMGAAVIGLSCLNLYHWYLTGALWVPGKYSKGWFTTSGEAPVLFVFTFGVYLLFIVVGTALIALGITSPAGYRKRQQARLASKEKPPPHPWPSRTKGPG